MLSTVLSFREGRVIVPFLRRRTQVFPRVRVIMKAIRRIVGQQTICHKVVSFLLFCLLFVEGKMTNTSNSSLRSFHIYSKLNGRRECKALYEEKGIV